MTPFASFAIIDQLKEPLRFCAVQALPDPFSCEVIPINITDRLPHESGRDYACRVIKENIINLELVPGSLVSEKELAQQLSLSRTPVREALIDLSKVGVIEVLPQRGSRISYIDYQIVGEAQFVRNALELAVCRQLCQTADLESMAPLMECIQAQEAAISAGDAQGFFHLDDHFHALLLQAGGLYHAQESIGSLLVHFDRVRNLSLRVITPEQLLADHKQLIFALLSHDEPLVLKTVELHLNRFRVDESVIRQQYPNYIKPTTK